MTTPDHGVPGPGELLFAYGSLQRGGQYHFFLAGHDAEFLGVARLLTPYPLLLAEYPCLLDRPGAGHLVHGEVYRIGSTRNWRELDRLEGHPEEYLRRPEPVALHESIVRAWTYFYQCPERLDPSLEPVSRFNP